MIETISKATIVEGIFKAQILFGVTDEHSSIQRDSTCLWAIRVWLILHASSTRSSKCERRCKLVLVTLRSLHGPADKGLKASFGHHTLLLSTLIYKLVH